MRLRRSAAVLSVLILSLSASPASAGFGVGVFQGTASVGLTAGDCAKSGPNTNPSGQGLGLPSTSPPDNINGFWRLESMNFVVWSDTNGNIVPDGGMDICGKLTDVAGIGAACGMSKGYAGVGKIYSDPTNTDPIIGLNDVGWKASTAGTLPVIGRTNLAGDKDAKVGTLLAVAQAEGGVACFSPGGATAFVVTGVAVVVPGELSWNDITDPIDCKSDFACPGQLSPVNIWGPKK